MRVKTGFSKGASWAVSLEVLVGPSPGSSCSAHICLLHTAHHPAVFLPHRLFACGAPATLIPHVSAQVQPPPGHTLPDPQPQPGRLLHQCQHSAPLANVHLCEHWVPLRLLAGPPPRDQVLTLYSQPLAWCLHGTPSPSKATESPPERAADVCAKSPASSKIGSFGKEQLSEATKKNSNRKGGSEPSEARAQGRRGPGRRVCQFDGELGASFPAGLTMATVTGL